MSSFKPGNRVVLQSVKGDIIHGTVRWVGPITRAELGGSLTVIGIETDKKVKLDNHFPELYLDISGSNGEQLFKVGFQKTRIFLPEQLVRHADEFAKQKEKDIIKQFEAQQAANEYNLDKEDIHYQQFILDKFNALKLQDKATGLIQAHSPLSPCDSLGSVVGTGEFSRGSLVCVPTEEGKPLHGVVMWIGTLPDFPGTIAGVELEEPLKGCRDGTWDGVRYFHCPLGRGYFCPLISLQHDIRYLDEEEKAKLKNKDEHKKEDEKRKWEEEVKMKKWEEEVKMKKWEEEVEKRKWEEEVEKRKWEEEVEKRKQEEEIERKKRDEKEEKAKAYKIYIDQQTNEQTATPPQGTTPPNSIQDKESPTTINNEYYSKRASESDISSTHSINHTHTINTSSLNGRSRTDDHFYRKGTLNDPTHTINTSSLNGRSCADDHLYRKGTLNDQSSYHNNRSSYHGDTHKPSYQDDRPVYHDDKLNYSDNKSGNYGNGRHGNNYQGDIPDDGSTVVNKETAISYREPEVNVGSSSERKERRNYEEEYRQLYDDYKVLKQAYIRVNRSQQEREEQCRQLQESHDNLVINYREKQEQIRILQDNYNALERKMSSLQKELQHKDHSLLPRQGMDSNLRFSYKEVSLSNQELGRGGWGVVWVGFFRGSRVAVKQIHELISDYKILHREINIMSQLRHPNLLQFIGAVFDHPSGNPLIITEVMDTSLRKAYEEKQLTPDQQPVILSIMRDVAVGLNYLHCLPDPIIHRDVSSANVLLESKGPGKWKTKISDFGSAKMASLANTTGPGSMVYTAPECIHNVLDSYKLICQSPSMDVFSYGILLCEILTCTFPANGRFRQLLEQINTVSLHDLIVWCVERKPDNRPSMGQIIDTIDSIL